MELKRRLERLEAHFGERDCICRAETLVRVIDFTRNPNAVASEPAVCPVHGPVPMKIIDLTGAQHARA